ncbi:MAG: hypothetical protein KDA88_07455 [Planctomycetaceae bacterium]|nr:hypothetical protein [Planctomycetaceae bacterium]MCA9033011.1 hypothetical protein [Planctomycetaceae bacterium]MCB9949663.1 aspartate carbamoyltransferase [Planctomycetaceae bacterium]
MKPSQLAPFLRTEDSRIQSLIFAQQFSRDLIERLVRCADQCRSLMLDREGARFLKSRLADKAVALYFPQCSTRTFTSFSFAAQSLGMMVEEIRDTELSAMYKGESELDMLLTLSTLADAVVMRQMDAEVGLTLAYEIRKRGMQTKIINAGSGADQHPTQALLELYTLLSHFRETAAEFGDHPKTVSFVGDLKRSRTARSLCYLLGNYPKIKQVFVAPAELQMESDLLGYLDECEVAYECLESLDDVIGESDAIYMMRIQDEYSATSEELRRRYEQYHLPVEKLNRMKSTACILHPLPRRAEIPIEIDYDSRAKYWDAVRCGKHMRMALLLHMFGRDDISSASLF